MIYSICVPFFSGNSGKCVFKERQIGKKIAIFGNLSVRKGLTPHLHTNPEEA
jgi:hypothetical protein